MLRTRCEESSTELTPLGNGFLFLLFLIVAILPIFTSMGMLSVVERLIIDQDGGLGKMRNLGWSRLLSLPILLPFNVALLNVVKYKNQFYHSNIKSFIISLAITPIIIFFAYLVMFGFQIIAASPGQDHPLLELFRSGRSMDYWLVLGLVIISAPITEEVMFRGLFQQWIVSAKYGPILGWLISMGLVSLHGFSNTSLRHLDIRFWVQAAAFLALGAISICIGLIYSKKYGAIFSAALVFAAIHSFAWPSPAGLLPLALGLGWLREITGRIWPCIFVHAAFNWVGTLMV